MLFTICVFIVLLQILLPHTSAILFGHFLFVCCYFFFILSFLTSDGGLFSTNIYCVLLYMCLI